MRSSTVLSLLAALTLLGGCPSARADDGCRFGCDEPEVGVTTGALTAAYFALDAGTAFATDVTPGPQDYHWQLLAACDVTDPVLGGCLPGVGICNPPPDRVVAYYVVQRQRLVRADGQPVDGQTPPPGAAPGSGFGSWSNVYRGCVDVTALNPPPTPGEVYRYFRTLPLPQLPLRQQPPGGTALTGLPVIFFTDAPTTQPYTVTIRGFTVAITATVTGYTWHTGDGTDLTTTDPGRPYPHQTVTHDYRSGSYTAALTTTWGATYTVDGGPTLTVPGTTTTDSAPVGLAVRQAHAVLTNPSD